MFPVERLEVLRQRNRDLLLQLERRRAAGASAPSTLLAPPVTSAQAVPPSDITGKQPEEKPGPWGSGGGPDSDRHHLQPLLGYDWIAAILDLGDPLAGRSDRFFDELRTFRSLHRPQCVSPPYIEEPSSDVLHRCSEEKSGAEVKAAGHQCIFSYRMNSRLFPVPLHPQERCPVCRRSRSSHTATSAHPDHLRVSVPCSRLQPPYERRARRRRSFDPADSLALPSHCLSGWSTVRRGGPPPSGTLDLRASLKAAGAMSRGPQEVSVPLQDVSRLPRPRLRHSRVKPGRGEVYS